MASIFKRGPDKRKRNTCYQITYTDYEGKRRTVIAFTDKGLTEQLAAKLGNEALLRRRGLVDANEERLAEEKRRPIEDLLAKFEETLTRRDDTAKHVKLVMSRIRTTLDGARINSPSDPEAERVEVFLHEYQNEEDLGHHTYDYFVQVIDSFSRRLASTKGPQRPHSRVLSD